MQGITRHGAESAWLTMMAIDAINAINGMPEVLSAGLIYHQFDNNDKQCEEMS
ncbi:nitrate reductase NapAB chaperone NapD [Aeromonas sp. BIGb0405]|nr:nitrate reductase NapAB chaperone NapD [Aeromonas sp. BIGb0405]